MAGAAGFQRGFELLQQGLLFPGQVHRRFHLHLAVEIADRAASYRLHALAAQAELLAALGFRGNLERDATVQGRDFDFAAEYGGRETDRHVAVQVAALAAEYTVGANVDLDVEIARRAAVFPGLAFTREPDAIPAVHAGGNFHGEIARFLLAPAPAAVGARLGDDRAGAAALRAGLLEGEESLLHADLPHATAGAAGLRFRARFGARSVAGFAGDEPRHADLDAVARNGLFQVE